MVSLKNFNYASMLNIYSRIDKNTYWEQSKETNVHYDYHYSRGNYTVKVKLAKSDIQSLKSTSMSFYDLKLFQQL